MNIIINPGSGPVPQSTEAQGWECCREFVADLDMPGVEFSRIPEEDYDAKYHDGRFAFVLRRGTLTCEVQMPGLPVEQVAYALAAIGGVLALERCDHLDVAAWEREEGRTQNQVLDLLAAAAEHLPAGERVGEEPGG